MSGLSTSGSISLGCALVAGRKRVPSPAAGKTALRTFAGITLQCAVRQKWAQQTGLRAPPATRAAPQFQGRDEFVFFPTRNMRAREPGPSDPSYNWDAEGRMQQIDIPIV